MMILFCRISALDRKWSFNRWRVGHAILYDLLRRDGYGVSRSQNLN